MSNNLYVTPTEPRSGKSAIALGLMEMLLREVGSVGFFRPVITAAGGGARDRDIELIRSHCALDIPYEDCYACTFDEANQLLIDGRQDELLDRILTKYRALEEHCGFVLCEGTDFESVTSALEFDINADIANNLGAPVLFVANARGKSAEEAVSSTRRAIESFQEKGVPIVAVLVNRAGEDQVAELQARIGAPDTDALSIVIPEEPTLGKPTTGEIVKWLNAEVVSEGAPLDQHVSHYTVAAMQLRNFLRYLREGSLIITPGDRGDVVLGSLASRISSTYPNIAGVLLTGGMRLDEPVSRLIDGWSQVPAPILLAEDDTFTVTQKLTRLHTEIDPEDKRKIATVLRTFESHVDQAALFERLAAPRTPRVTPKVFEYGLIQKAKAHRQRIVLPEGEDARIIAATEIIARRDTAEIVLLGDRNRIAEALTRLGIDLPGVEVVDPANSERLQDYARCYHELRGHKGVTPEGARDIMTDATYFGTMMVHLGDADGMVSGAVHTTQHTVRPAFEFIRTKPGCAIVSSVFFMCLKDRVLVYGDCAVNPNPDAGQLAEIALSAAETARVFGVEPRMAMLSYSSGDSGKGTDVEKVREATRIARGRAPELKLEGPIQYDAAIDPEVARTKMPDSEVAGRATVFVFPDLNTGNNTYKAVQRSAGAVAIGPILQGLRKPVNDLSRGCTVPDIVNTVAITAIQAQAEKGLL